VKVTRRQVLKGMGAALGAAACGGGAAGEPPDGPPPPPDARPPNDARPPDAPPPDAPPPDAPPPDAGPPDLCAETGTLSPEELLAPIDTIVVLCMENRSFDHYLGSLLLIEGRAVDGLTGAELNLAPDGSSVGVHLLEDFTPEDPPHGWDACHAQWNGGANDGFVIAHAGASQDDVMGYHIRGQLPTTYQLADEFALCERWHCSLLGPTWPNRFYLHGATSNGQQGNSPIFSGFTSIFQLLDDAGVSNRNYYHDVAWCSGGYFKLSGLATIEQFFDDAAAGTLPSFSIIDPQFFGAGANDDHPDHDIQLGQALIASIYAALAASPQWSRCLFVITYDEHGGFYDHVPPGVTTDDEPDFAQLGFRVPAIVAGPYVRPGCVVSTPFEHVSVISTLTRRFGLPSLNARAAATADLSSCISPSLVTAMPRLPPRLTPVPISLARLRARAAGGWQGGEHPELAAAARDLPRAFDRRADGLAIAERVLRAGARLGAVTLR
jgi:phospholipase C